MFEMGFRFSKLVKSIEFRLGVFESTERLAAQSAAYALRNRLDIRAFVKENKKNISRSRKEI